MESLLYKVKDRPPFGRTIIFALQQLLSILAGTITLPLIVGNGMSQSAALFGAAVGTLLYLVITKFKSPVFLGSSFTYLGSMSAAFAGAASMAIGYLGLLIGALLAGLVYVILSIVVKYTGTNWVNKVMPPVIIGPTVAIIALTLSPNAMNNIQKGSVLVEGSSIASPYLCILCGLVTLAVAIVCSTYGKGMIKLIPFIIGIIAGYLLASIFTVIGNSTNTDILKIVDYSAFNNIKWVPDFTFLKIGDAIKDFSSGTQSFGKYFLLIFTSYVPVSFAVFAEHIADHKNISFIIGDDLLTEPGLSRTLMGDGVGSMVGAMFGGCPNTTYGESISCVAFSRNASVITIVCTCFISIVVSFFGPLMAFFSTIPTCVIGGLCIALYGFIASSGLRMLKVVDLNDMRNIFVISTIFVTGIGGLIINCYYFVIPSIAVALVMGILVNLLTHIKKKKDDEPPSSNKEDISK